MSAAFARRVALVAHQGGWDELLLVAGPIVVIVAVLAVAKRRVDASYELRDDTVDPHESDHLDPPNRHGT